jgi:hypothetical protein
MEKINKRRNFIKTTASAGIGLGILNQATLFSKDIPVNEKRIGIIGLDTSHCVAFTKEFNDSKASSELGGYRIVAAYPKGSNDIESSYSRIPKYTEDVKKMGVQITNSIEELLDKVDYVLLETNDGRLHLEQAMKVLKAGKTMFIDKPIAASLKDAIAIFDEAAKRKVPIFSCSSLRFMETAQAVVKGKGGNVVGAFTFSPAPIEKTHPDLFWYGIHGVEILFTVMGSGCKEVIRVFSEETDIVVGRWNDGRIGTFRGIRKGKEGYGGDVFCESAVIPLGQFEGYKPLLLEIVRFFNTGIPPVKPEETLDIIAFMEAADESKRMNGAAVSLESVRQRAK